MKRDPSHKIYTVLNIIAECGGIDGAHHKQWVLDQIVQVCTEDDYAEWVREYCDGEDGPDTYHWDVGIPP